MNVWFQLWWISCRSSLCDLLSCDSFIYLLSWRVETLMAVSHQLLQEKKTLLQVYFCRKKCGLGFYKQKK